MVISEEATANYGGVSQAHAASRDTHSCRKETTNQSKCSCLVCDAVKDVQYTVISLNINELHSLTQEVRDIFMKKKSCNSSSLTKIQKLPRILPTFPLPNPLIVHHLIIMWFMLLAHYQHKDRCHELPISTVQTATALVNQHDGLLQETSRS